MKKRILQARPTRTITLPDTGVEVTFYSSLLVKDLQNIDLKKINDDVSESLKMLQALIKEWNLYLSEDDEKPAEITPDNIGALTGSDFSLLMEEIAKFQSEQKKS